MVARMSKADALDVADRLHSAAIRLLRTVRAADDAAGLSAPKLSALSVLIYGGARSLTGLARAEQVTAATMSKLVSDLEADGLVAKRVDAADRRGVRIEATAKGKALFQDARKRRLELLRGRVARLSASERARLRDAAELMLRVAEGAAD
jgi:DNA-binding MarR family transcriptional regulator